MEWNIWDGLFSWRLVKKNSNSMLSVFVGVGKEKELDFQRKKFEGELSVVWNLFSVLQTIVPLVHIT